MDVPEKEIGTQIADREERSSWRFTLLLVALAASAAVTPMFFLSNASGHDFMFHLASWMDAASQWREGILYPRWAEWANWGFGEPRFIFYPPGSWMIGAALGSVMPWRVVPGAFIWLTMIASGMSMWKLSREWLPGPQATAAAALYAISPYTLVTAYYRSDFAELLAIAFLPLLISGALHVARDGWRRVPALGIAFAAIWLANAPAAVIATYSLALAISVQCFVRRSLKTLLPGATAMAVGFGLAAFYILPAAWERRWVQIGEAVSGDLSAAQSFLFTRANDPEFVIFNWKVSWVAMGVMALTGFAAVFVARRRRDFYELWWILIALGAASVALMFRPSAWLWHLPELQYVQFPWRWLEILDLVFAFLIAAAMSCFRKRKLGRVMLALVFAAIVVSAAAIINDAWWDDQGVPVIADAIRTGHGYEGTDEYMPLNCDRFELPGNPDDTTRPADVAAAPAPSIQKIDSHSGAADPVTGGDFHIERWTAERKIFSAQTAGPTTLALRLLSYPAWQVQVDGVDARAGSADMTGQLLVPLSPGAHRVDVRFRETWDRITGDAISAFTGIALLGFTFIARRRDQV